MNADMKWLDNPEVFRVNQLEAHSDHTYYESYEALEKKENALHQYHVPMGGKRIPQRRLQHGEHRRRSRNVQRS